MLHTGLIGRSIKASRSPWLHEQEARAQGLELSYDLFDFTELGLADADLGAKLRQLAAEGYLGVNITFPFKQTVIPLLDELAECARTVGAVNTVAMREGRLCGYNTDKTGFQESLTEGLPDVRLDHILQLGAGGAGAAVGNALLSLGVGQLEIVDVDRSRAEVLAKRLCSEYGPERARPCNVAELDITAVQGIVNTTPIGMAAHPGSPIDPELISSQHWVADIVYFPIETELLRIASSKGCRTMNGSGMVVGQAARAFQIFTGRKADKQRMGLSFVAP